MNVTVRVTKSFKLAVKSLLKKHPSLQKDLLKLEDTLVLNPTMGVPLGHSTYKIRLTITSKGKGKRSGARVISLVESIVIKEITTEDEQVTVNLITIYDKADIETISDKELKALIKAFHQEQ